MLMAPSSVYHPKTCDESLNLEILCRRTIRDMCTHMLTRVLIFLVS